MPGSCARRARSRSSSRTRAPRRARCFRVVKVMVEKTGIRHGRPQDGAYLKDRFRQATVGASMTDYSPFPADRPFRQPARGAARIHGKAAADRLRRGAKMYAESLLKNGVELEGAGASRRAAGAASRDVRAGLHRGDARHRRGRGRTLRCGHADERPHRDGRRGAPASRRRKHFSRRLHRRACAGPEASADSVLLHGQKLGLAGRSAPRPAWSCASAATTGPTS